MTTLYAALAPDALDTAIADVTDAVAAMIGQVLEPYGVGQSVPGPADTVDVSPESGVFVEHIAFRGQATDATECADDVLATLRSRYYLAPAAADTATAIRAAQNLIVPVIRAHRKHIEHTVSGQQIACRLQDFDVVIHTRGGDTGPAYVTLLTTCTLSLEVMEPYDESE